MRGEPNRLLRRVREDRQESREEFARAVQIRSGELCDERTVKRWEDGTVRLPRPVFRRAVTALTGKSPGELGWAMAGADAVDPEVPSSGPAVDPDGMLGSLRHAELAARSTVGAARSATFSALTHAYHACAAALVAVGQNAAAWVAADRAILTAEAAGDELLMAEGAVRLAALLQAVGQLDRAERTASSAVVALAARAEAGELVAQKLSRTLRDQLAQLAVNRHGRAHAGHPPREREPID